MNYEVTAQRVGEETNREGNQDPKLIALDQALVSTLSSTSGQTVVAEVTLTLTDTYGGQNVTSSQADPEYVLTWDPVKGRWDWVCIDCTTLLVNDGEPKPVSVEIAIRTFPK